MNIKQRTHFFTTTFDVLPTGVGVREQSVGVKSGDVVQREENAGETWAGPSFDLAPRRLQDLLALPLEQLGEVDVGLMNLLCSSRLPGTESFNLNNGLKLLDELAAEATELTENSFDYFESHREQLRNSHAVFRLLCLSRFLWHRLHLIYCEEERDLNSDADWTKTNRHFLFGLLQPPYEGTCASLPVIFVAVGRRMGYPLKLVHSPGHVFCRWEGLDHPLPMWREQHNIDFNGNFDLHSDEHYYEKPVKWRTEWYEQEKLRGLWPLYLRSLTPAEELASFLVQRAHALEALGELEEAHFVYGLAVQKAPHNDTYLLFAKECHRQLLENTLKPWKLTAAEFCQLTEKRIQGKRVKFPWERSKELRKSPHNPMNVPRSANLLQGVQRAIAERLAGLSKPPPALQYLFEKYAD